MRAPPTSYLFKKKIPNLQLSPAYSPSPRLSSPLLYPTVTCKMHHTLGCICICILRRLKSSTIPAFISFPIGFRGPTSRPLFVLCTLYATPKHPRRDLERGHLEHGSFSAYLPSFGFRSRIL